MELLHVEAQAAILPQRLRQLPIEPRTAIRGRRRVSTCSDEPGGRAWLVNILHWVSWMDPEMPQPADPERMVLVVHQPPITSRSPSLGSIGLVTIHRGPTAFPGFRTSRTWASMNIECQRMPPKKVTCNVRQMNVTCKVSMPAKRSHSVVSLLPAIRRSHIL